MRISTYIQRTDFITALTVILFQICLLALWGGPIYAAVKIRTFCFGYPNQFWGWRSLPRAGRSATGAGRPEAAETLIGADIRGARIRRILRRRILCGGLPL